MRTRTTKALALAAWVCLIQASTAGAQDATAPRVSEVLRSATDFLAQAPGFAVHAELDFDEVISTGQKVRFNGAFDAALQRPNQMFVDYRGDRSSRRFWYDGETATLLNPESGMYAEYAFTGDIDQMIDALREDTRLTLPLSGIVRMDAYQEITSQVRRASYLGIHDVEGTPSHHLYLVGDDVDVQIWVAVGDQPLLTRVLIEYKTQPGAPQYSAVFMDWVIEKPDGKLFAVQLPEEGTRIDFLSSVEGSR